MTNKDSFDDMLRDAAKSYNAPPETPRDAMWHAVRQGLDEEAGAESSAGDAFDVERSDAKVVPINRPHPDWLRWATGIAAALVVGFGLGRWQTSDRGDVTGVISSAQDDRQGGAASASPQGSQPVQGIQPDQNTSARSRSANEPAPSRERATSSAYQVAAVQHLTQMEMLLTSFRAEAHGGRVMDELSVWAGDLLGTTRLLLDSPAGNDQRLKRLLEDLELVLAQIAQLGPGRQGQEVEMINEAVEWRNVLPRLRSAIPAGSTPAGI